ncbi:MAG TPA: F0F1 ATP synthase subunit A [Firmicutes bacterium]|nr:F0F1 ATP synthase subunit A [Bacillota bacterium]
MGAVMQIASSDHTRYLVGGEPLWEKNVMGFDLSFTPGITTWMVVFWVIMAGMIIAGIIAARKKAMVPKGIQNFAEWCYGSLTNFFGGIIGEDKVKRFGPLLVTFFMFILLCNYSGLFPLNLHNGELSNLQAPTAVFSVTLGFAMIVFFVTHFAGARYNGFGYLKHFISPIAVMLPFLIIEEIVHPLTLSLRLYGNVFGEETVVQQLTLLCPWVVPAIMEILGVLFGLIQALVFSLLAAIYISTASSKAH